MYFSTIQPLSFPPLRIIAVRGDGKVEVQPDYVQLQVEVRTEEKDISVAQRENAIIMARIIQSLLELNIPRDDIQTVAYNVFPNYDFIEGKQVFRGYEVTNAVSVKLTDISEAGTIMETAVKEGANHISGLQFGMENPNAHYQDALRLALHDAQTKAETIAETMKLPLHPQPVEIVEENETTPILFKTTAMVNQAASTTPIEQGKITISATVKVKFQF